MVLTVIGEIRFLSKRVKGVYYKVKCPIIKKDADFSSISTVFDSISYYQKAIDEKINAAKNMHGQEISRNSFDRLIW